MKEQQKIINIQVSQLKEKVKEFKNQGYRLVQISCTRLENFELSYSFDKNYEFVYLRFSVAKAEDPIPSVSGIYWCAFLYENELHDLFGLNIKDIVIDYKGQFYTTAIKNPFGQESKQEDK